MSLSLTVGVLGTPALLLAGLGSGWHCALMCAPLHVRLGGGHPVALQAGRLAAYGTLGAVVGGLGGGLLRPGFLTDVAPLLRIVVLVALAASLLLPMRARANACCVKLRSGASRDRGVVATLAAGFVAGLAPCFVLIGALAYASLSGTAWQGAWLMLAFGIGTLPGLQAGMMAWRRFAGAGAPLQWRRATAFAIFALVAVLTVAGDLHGNTGWCIG